MLTLARAGSVRPALGLCWCLCLRLLKVRLCLSLFPASCLLGLPRSGALLLLMQMHLRLRSRLLLRLLSWLLLMLILLLKVRLLAFRFLPLVFFAAAAVAPDAPGRWLLQVRLRLRSWILLQLRLLWLPLMLLSWLLPMLLLVRLWASPFVPLVAAKLRVS